MAGICHPVNEIDNGKLVSGFAYDTRYKSISPAWSTDPVLARGSNVSKTHLSEHSFAVYGSYSTQAAAVSAQAKVVANLSNATKYTVTWRSAVKQSPTSKQWMFEVDYNGIAPQYWAHTQIADKPNVTAASKGSDDVVVTPKPTDPVTPGGADMGTTNPTTPTAPNTPPPGVESKGVKGIDVSMWTTTQDWTGWKSAGKQFLFTKASEGNYGGNKNFATQYAGGASNMAVRGAYHFANPSVSDGVSQAEYFIAHGGGWTNDGKTLPGTLDIEWNPYSGGSCYGMSKAQMNQWISDFATTYKAKTGVLPIIYTANAWFNSCVGSDYDYSKYTLWMASYASSMGPVPAAWSNYGGQVSIWQTNPVDSKGYDEDVYLGTLSQLRSLAKTGIAPRL